MRAIDPSSGNPVGEYPDHDAAEVEARVVNATTAFAGWSRRSFAERAAPMRRVAELLRERKRDLAVLMAKEMGKPVKQGASEVDKCALTCEFYADRAESLLRDEAVSTEAKKSFVAYVPLGPVLAIMPWNFPLWQVIRFAAPSVMAGNVAIVKHASGVPGCALAIEKLFDDAGFPEGVLAVVLVHEDEIPPLIADPRIAAVTLTGSTRAGRSVASHAGQALKKVVLELGGSDPYVVLADADLDVAVTTSVAARMINGGQSCIAGKRFVVVKPRLAEFEKRFVEAMEKTKMGDPQDARTELGPMARVELRDALHRQVEQSVARGARLLSGGAIPERAGAWYPPTVLAAVTPGMPAFDEELFGPVGAIVAAEDDEQAIRLANQTSFGLGACVFTRDLERGARIAKDELAAGACFVNAQVRSDPRLPFGGVKDSGHGRELGALGIREFVNAKCVWIA